MLTCCLILKSVIYKKALNVRRRRGDSSIAVIDGSGYIVPEPVPVPVPVPEPVPVPVPEPERVLVPPFIPVSISYLNLVC